MIKPGPIERIKGNLTQETGVSANIGQILNDDQAKLNRQAAPAELGGEDDTITQPNVDDDPHAPDSPQAHADEIGSVMLDDAGLQSPDTQLPPQTPGE